MFIVTEKKTGQPLALTPAAVLFVRKDREDKITTRIITNIMGPQGLQSIEVEEDVEEVARRRIHALQLEMQNQHPIEWDKYGFGKQGEAVMSDRPSGLIKN